MTENNQSPTFPDRAGERADILEALRMHRGLFLTAVRGVSEEQAASTPTASTLCLGGLVKHVAATEAEWARFVTDGPAQSDSDVDWANIDWSNPPPEVVAYTQQFQMLEGETLDGLVAEYERVAAATDELVATVDLDLAHPLPAAPWFPPDATRTARRTFMHIVAETAQHAGHADIIRETIDGHRTMA